MSNADRLNGFTLIEVMAVMMIIALASSLIFAVSPGTGRAGLKAAVFETAALLRRERESAILSGRDRGVALDSERRTVIGQTAGTVALPRDVALDVLGADRFSGMKRAVVQFHPDGASSGAVLRFSRDQAGYMIRVNWFTGRVAIDAL